MVRKSDYVDELYVDTDLSLLKKITLVIPTYNRNFYLSRCLWYHAHFPYAQIIVADSSSGTKLEKNREIIETIKSSFNVEILHLIYDLEPGKYGEGYYWKWGDAIEHVSTEYSQICTDKEFMIPSTQCSCISFLEKHDDYGSASGRYQYIVSSKKNDLCRCQHVFPELTSQNYSNSFIRLIDGLDVPWKTISLFAIKRTSEHKSIFQQLLKYNICDLRFGEVMIELIGYVSNKSIYFSDLPYLFRDVTHVTESYSSSNRESSNMRYPFLSLYEKDIYENYYHRALSYLLNSFSSWENIFENTEDFRKYIDEKFTEFLIKRKIYYGPVRPPDNLLLWIIYRFKGIVGCYVPENIKSIIVEKGNNNIVPPEKIPENYNLADRNIKINLSRILMTSNCKYKKDESVV